MEDGDEMDLLKKWKEGFEKKWTQRYLREKMASSSNASRIRMECIKEILGVRDNQVSLQKKENEK